METTQPFDDRAQSFLQVGDVAFQIAERHSQVDVDATTHERWRQLMGLLREFDTMVDDTDMEHGAALVRLRDFSDFSDRYPALSPDALDLQTREKLLSRTNRLLQLGQFVAAAETSDRFVKLRINEGRQTANLLEDSATPYVKEQTNFSESFLPAIRSLGVTACTIDSMTDARQDYRQHKMNLQPDLEYYQRLAGATLHHAPLGAKALFHPAIMKEFVVMSGIRLHNRITHGVTDSSSLHNFR